MRETAGDRFVMTACLCKAIRRAPYGDRQRLAVAAALTPSQLSTAAAGVTFGPVVRARLEQVGASLGLRAKSCTRKFVPSVAK